MKKIFTGLDVQKTRWMTTTDATTIIAVFFYCQFVHRGAIYPLKSSGDHFPSFGQDRVCVSPSVLEF